MKDNVDFEGLDLTNDFNSKQSDKGSNPDLYALVEKKQLNSLNKMVFDFTKFQKIKLYSSIFFRFVFWVTLIVVIYLIYKPASNSSFFEQKEILNTHTDSVGIIKVQGAIFEGGLASASSIINALRRAYDNENTKAIILDINSPGGSPVQSSLIYDEILRLKKEHKKRNIKIYTVVKDIALSGAYYIAAASDYIYANKSSLVGSIGVILSSFNFEGLLDKFGIKRVVLKSGKNKDILDPFQKSSQENIAHVQGILNNIHRNFIEDVKAQRKDRLANNPDIYSGLFWDARQALKLGLIDGFGDIKTVSKDIIKVDNTIDYTVYPNYWENIANNFF